MKGKSLKLKPANNRILIKPDEVPDETVTDGGIVIPHTDSKRIRHGVSAGVVLAIGPDAWKEYVDQVPSAKVGDRVHFAPQAGRFIEHPETKEVFKIMYDADIMITEELEGE